MTTYLRSFTLPSVALRMLLAIVSGCVLGYGRSKKKRAAGLRTYVLTSIGACLAILLTEYEYTMLQGPWADVVQQIGEKFDATRYGAQVITGIGFLGAGTIIASGHQQVSGLTTATGLFAATCLGIAAGAGFVECVAMVLVPLVLVLDFSYPLEYNFKRRLRNMTVFVRFASMADLRSITSLVEERGATVFDLDVETTDRKGDEWPSAVLSLRLSREKPSHSEMLSSIA